MPTMPLLLLRLLPSRRTKNRIWLIFSDSSKLPFFADDVVLLGLKTNLDISNDLFEEIKIKCLYYLLYNYSLNQIALSPKNSQTLTPKIRQKLHFYLRKYKLSGDYVYLIDEIIAKLSHLNLLDDLAFGQHLLRKNKKHSRQYISRLFSFYHLTLPPDFLNNDVENIKDILLKKKYTSVNWAENSVKNKIIASLARKGFAYNDIKNAIDEIEKNR